MANIVIVIPDAQVTRVVDALCLSGKWTEDLGVSRTAFAKAEAARLLRERVLSIERQTMLSQAAATAAALSEPQID